MRARNNTTGEMAELVIANGYILATIDGDDDIRDFALDLEDVMTEWTPVPLD